MSSRAYFPKFLRHGIRTDFASNINGKIPWKFRAIGSNSLLDRYAENNEERWLGYIGAFFLANFRHGNRVFVNPLNWKMNSNPRIMKILVCKLCCFPFLYFYISFFFFFFRINLSKIQNNFRSNFKFEMEVKEEESSVLNWLKFAVNSPFQNYFLIFPF